MLDKDGYLKRYAPDHLWPRKGGYVREHVRIMELHIGRRIKVGEVVHHKDHDLTNNALENLELLTHGEHSRRHRALDKHHRVRDLMGRFAAGGRRGASCPSS
jgi:HNH endonuclease